MGVSVRDGPRSSNRVHTRRFFFTNLIFTSGGTRGSKPRKKRLNFQLRTKGGRFLSQRGAFLMRITFSTSSFCSVALSFL